MLILNALHDCTKIVQTCRLRRCTLLVPGASAGREREVEGALHRKGAGQKTVSPKQKRQSRDWRSRARGTALPRNQYTPGSDACHVLTELAGGSVSGYGGNRDCAIVGLPKSLRQVAPLYFVAAGRVN